MSTSATTQFSQTAVPVNNLDSPSAATSGSVPAQQPARSYASATKTASAQPTSTPASQHAQDISVNGTMAAQGSVQPATNGNIPNGTSDHARKPSVVISASGASGHITNGGPVGQSSRPPINFGMMNPTQAQDQSSSLPAPSDNPRVISPAHSPSPIPHPATSGGRPPSSLQAQGNGPAFGSIAGDASAQTPQFNPAHMHERRPSSQSMQSGDSNMGRSYAPQAGRGRGYPQQYGQMGSPAQAFRQLSNPGRPGMNNQFPSGNLPQNAQFRPPNRQQSPAIGHVQPQVPYYGGYQPQGMYTPDYNAYGGYYQPYGYAPQFGSPGQSGSPRPQYPNPYTGSGQGQPPFMPPNMARTPSQASDRPGSSIGHPGTPSQAHAAPSHPGAAQASGTGVSFVKPKKSSAIKITNEKGETINFGKPATAAATVTATATATTPQASTPVIAHTPNAPTPPPRTPSAQHTRTESKSVPSQDETREAFKRQVEEKRRAEESAKATESKPAEPTAAAAAKDVVKEAAAEAEKTAAVAAGDKEGEKAVEAETKSTGETDEQRKKREEDEEEERLIAEMEAAEREEEEREKAFQEKRKLEKEAAAKKESEKAAKADEELKRQEREAEERELEREREREAEKGGEEADDESKTLFASLKRSNLGPGASATESQDTSADETPAETAPQTAASRSSAAQKPKPAHLKLETNRKVEPAEPTPGMQSLKSARFLELKEEALYPQGISSPNPALNASGARKGRAYDKDFLLQFQNVFREKPSVDWDQKVRDTLGPGDEPGSARPQSARTPSGAAGRSASSRGAPAASSFGGPMGTFGNAGQGRTLPVGTTSQERFMASSRGMGMPGQMGRVPSQLGMGAPNMGVNRTNSLQALSPRQPSSRGGKGASKRDNRQPSRKDEADMAARMPLTASGEVKALEKSTTGWKPASLTAGPMANAPSLDGHMAPDMVQRKVKAALNKMTPEKFDKISDQILEIASQSKNETDGRTLRQVIQLTFEKACDEAHWAQMYAQFCHKMLTAMSPEIRDETIKDKSGAPVVGGALFRKYLLNRCQEEFERGWQVNLPDKPEGETEEAALLSDEYYIAAAAKRKGLGLIAFIGQLYKLNMLTSRIMHECVLRLLNFEGAPDESAIETLTTLLKSVGSTMDADPQGHSLVDTYFQRINEKILSDAELPSRPRFMIMDLMDLRRAKWQGKDNLKGPKTIAEIHAEAEAAQAKAEVERLRSKAGARPGGGRQDSRNFSGQMAPPVDYSRTNVSSDDLRRLQNRGSSNRSMGGGLGPGGSLGPSGLSARAGSRRGNLGPSGSGNSTRTSTPPVGDKDKKEEPAQQNSFSALENLETEEAESPEVNRDRSKSPLPEAKAEEA